MDEFNTLNLQNKKLTEELLVRDEEIEALALKLEETSRAKEKRKYREHQLASENEELKKKVSRKERKMEALEHRMAMVKEQNSAMQLRDAEWTYTKIKEYVGMRSTIIVDASLFADFTHRSDPLLQETPVSVLDSKNFLNVLVATEKYEKGVFSKTTLASLSDGTPVTLKRYHIWEGKDADVKSLQFVSHEARLLKYLGKHPNITFPYGIVQIRGAFHIALKYEGNLSLRQFLQNDVFGSEAAVQSVVEGICAAIVFLHEKDVLHNHIRCGNILLPQFGDGYRPVLIGFAFACRHSVGKLLSKEALEKFKEIDHFPPEVIARKSRPSFQSDVFSYGVIMRRILARRLPVADYVLYKLKKIMERCTDYDPEIRSMPNVLRVDINSAFYDMYAQ